MSRPSEVEAGVDGLTIEAFEKNPGSQPLHPVDHRLDTRT